MSQIRQNSRGTVTDVRRRIDAGTEDSTMQADTVKIISCSICRAVYIPSSQQRAEVPRSATLLETAFLRICHFCFRCQRPACPQCWNPVHQVCFACGEEAHLPFLSPVPALEGLIICAPQSSQSAPAQNQSFTCLRNGRFCSPDHVAPSEPPKVEVPREYAPPEMYDQPLEALDQALLSASSYPYPSWIQEVLGHKTESPSVEPPSCEHNRAFSDQQSISHAQPAQAEAPVSPHTSQPDWATVAYALPQLAELPPLLTDDKRRETEERDDVVAKEPTPLIERVENILLVITSTLLLAIVVMIVLAVSSADMNTFFLRLMHVDIRTEISYFLQLR